MNARALEAVLRRDSVIVVAALVAVTVLAWVYVLRLAAAMDMSGMDMSGFRMISTGFAMAMAPAQAAWSAVDFVLMFAMWAVMMVGMMTPSATPMILIYARAARTAEAAGRPLAATSLFAAGYLLVWVGFALLATTAQWALERVGLLDPMMGLASTVLGGGVLIAAGLYQLSPLKYACLLQCQSPLAFIQRHGGLRRSGLGALRLGGAHGFYCLGCCWVLMILLFVGGVMNVLWIAALAILALAEKVVPAGRFVAQVAGVGLIVAGVRLLVR
jgi:predicted metal-binding membrane protein